MYFKPGTVDGNTFENNLEIINILKAELQLFLLTFLLQSFFKCAFVDNISPNECQYQHTSQDRHESQAARQFRWNP